MNTMRKLVLVLGLVGCGAAAEPEAPMAACESRTHTLYVQTVEQLEGDCGVLPPSLHLAQEIDGPAAHCAMVRMASTACVSDLTVRCQHDDGVVTTHTRKVSWDRQGNAGMGTMEFEMTAPRSSCRSLYAVTYGVAEPVRR